MSTSIGMDYQVNDLGSDEAVVVIDVDLEFLAGGTITKSTSPGFNFNIGDQSKGQSGGFVKLKKQITYSGDVQYSVGDGFVLRCQRGASN